MTNFLTVLMLAPTIALADVIWPSIMLEHRLSSWWSIGLGFLFEWPFIKMVTSRSWKLSMAATFLVNAATTVLGMVLLPFLGIGLEIFLRVVPRDWFIFDMLLQIDWSITFLVSILCNTVIEAWVLQRVFKAKMSPKNLMWIGLANFISVGIAVASIYIDGAPLYQP